MGSLLQKFFTETGITEAENRLPHGKQTFTPHPYPWMDSELHNRSNRQQDYYFRNPLKHPNVLISYVDCFGQPIIENSQDNEDIDFYQESIQKWSYPYRRIRYDFRNPSEKSLIKSGEKRPKYRSKKGSKLHCFFNGIYIFYVKPLEDLGLDRNAIIAALRPIFKRIVITEGEKKAMAACRNGIPTIGISGIFGAVKSKKQLITTVESNQYEKTVGAQFIPELEEFLQLFEVEQINLLHDSDNFDNRHNFKRAQTFNASVRNFKWGLDKFNEQHEKSLTLDYTYLNSIPNKKLGIDDALLKFPKQTAAIQQHLLGNDVSCSLLTTVPLPDKQAMTALYDQFIDSAYKYTDYQFHLQGSEKISDHQDAIIPLYTKHQGSDLLRLEWKGGTGIGKTYFTKNILAPALFRETGTRSIIVFPMNILLEKQAAENGLIPLQGGIDEPELAHLLEQEIILTNQHQLPLLMTYFAGRGEKFHVFLDEAHELATASYKTDTVEDCWQGINAIAASITLMSATPNNLFRTLGFKRIDFSKTDRPPLRINMIPFTGSVEDCVVNHLVAVDTTRARTVTLVQNKDKIEAICHAIRQLTNHTIDRIYSDPAVRAGEAYQNIINTTQNGESLRGINHLLATLLLGIGLGLYGSERKIIPIYINDSTTFDIASIIQFMQRWRTEDSIEAYLYYRVDSLPTKKEELEQKLLLETDADNQSSLREQLRTIDFKITTRQQTYHAAHHFQELLADQEWLAQQHTLRLRQRGKSVFVREEISHQPYFRVEKDEVKVNTIYVMQQVAKQAIGRTGLEKFQKIINHDYPHVVLIPAIAELEASTPERLEVTAAYQQQAKETRLQAEHNIYQLLQTDRSIFLQALRLRTQDCEFTKIVKRKRGLTMEAQALIKLHSQLFRHHVNRAVAVWKRVQQLVKLGLPEDQCIEAVFCKQTSGRFSLLGNHSFHKIHQTYKNQLLLHCWKHQCTHLSYFDKDEARSLYHFKIALQQAFFESPSLSSREIYLLYRRSYGRQRSRKFLPNTNQVIMLANTLLKLKRSNGRYKSVEVIDLLELLEHDDKILNNMVGIPAKYLTASSLGSQS